MSVATRRPRTPGLSPHSRQEAVAYAAGYCVVVLSVMAVTTTASAPAWGLVAASLAAAGLISSFLDVNGEGPLSAFVRNVMVCAGLGALPLISLFVSPSLVMPDVAMQASDLRTTVLFTWMTVVLTFRVGCPRPGGSERAIPVSFLVVPGFTVFGLVATIDINIGTILLFNVFTLCSLFLVAYEQLLARGLVTGRRRSWLRHTSWVTGALFTAVTATGLIASNVLYAVVPPVFPMAVQRLANTMLNELEPPDYVSDFGETLPVRGGPGPQGDYTVMQVRATEPVYLRGRVYSRYDPRHQEWFIRDTPRRPLAVRNHSLAVSWDAAEAGNARPTTVVIVPEPGLEQWSLYSPGLPVLIRGRDLLYRDPRGIYRSRRGITVDSEGTIRLRDPSYSRYSVVALAAVDNPLELRKAPPVERQDVDPVYLEFPRSAEALRRVALEATQGIASPYARVEALQHYLTQHCAYSLDSPRVPPTQDPASYFVLRSHVGACDMFATALTLMSRAVGVPARLVTGYLATERNSMGLFEVRQKDAHAWTEVFLKGFGWVTVDGTVGAPVRGPLPLLRLLAHPWVKALRRVLLTHWPFILMGALFLMVAASVVTTARPTLPKPLAHRTRTPSHRLVGIYRRACGILDRHGLGRPADMTPREHMQRLRHAAMTPRSVIDAMDELASAVTRAAYADRPPTKRQLKQLSHAVGKMRRDLKRSSKEARRRRPRKPT